MRVEFETQAVDIYGIPVCYFPSKERDSTFFVSPLVGLTQRGLAVFSKIRRAFGYLPLLDLTPADYVQYVWGRLDADDSEPDNVKFSFMDLTTEPEEGYEIVTMVEF